MTTRRSVGWLTSSKPASAKILRLPTLHLARGDVLTRFHEHRVAFERPGAAAAREVDGGPNEGPADPSAAVPGPGENARHGPDAGVGLVLGAALPGNPIDAQQARVGGTRLDGAPADGFTIEVCDEAGGRIGSGIAALCLGQQARRSLLGGERGERLFRLKLVPLALAERRIAAVAEHGLQVVPGSLVRGNDGQLIGFELGTSHSHGEPQYPSSPARPASARAVNIGEPILLQRR